MNEHAVVVTGASTGIGRACALHLDSLGLRVFAGVRDAESGEALRRVASERLAPIHIDVTSASSIAAAADIVTAAVADSRLLGVVNNAGVAVAGPLEFLPIADLTRQFDINVVGHVRVTQAFMPLLRESHGRLVFVSSLGGRLSQPLVGAYCASKHALEAVADALRIELTPWDVNVALIEPGAVATPIWDKSLRAADATVAAASPRMREFYGAAIEAARVIAKRESERGVPPEQVAVAVEHALTAARPRTRYVVGREAKIALTLKRWLPDRVMDRLILRQGGLPTSADATASSPAEVFATSH